MNCEKCNGEIEEGAKACRWCGEEISTNNNNKNNNNKNNKNNHSRNKNKKVIIIATISLMCVIVVATIVIFALSKNSPNKSQGLDRTTARVTGITKNPPVNITGSDLLPTNTPTDVSDPEEDLSNSTEQLLYIKGSDHSIYYTSLDQLKPHMIVKNFKDRSGEESNVFLMSDNGKRIMYQMQPDLFSIDLSADNQKINKIDSNITQCKMNSTGTKMYYILENYNLYINDMAKKQLIDNIVSEFYINKQGDCVLYKKLDNNLYIKKENKDIQELGDAYIQFLYASEDLSKVYYQQDQTLYIIEDGNKPKIIASNISRVLQIYKSGAIYYLANSELKSDVLFSNLYFYTDGISTLVKEHCVEAGIKGSIYSAANKPIMVYSAIEESELKKKPNQNEYYNSKYYVCKEAKTIGQLGKVSWIEFMLNEKQDTIYYQKDTALYRVKIENEKLSKSTRCTGLDETFGFTLNGNEVMNIRTSNNGEQGLCIDGKIIDTQVDNIPIRIGNTNYYTYFKGESKTLMLYHEGKKQVIADHVTSYVAYQENKIAYVSSNSKGKRDLYLYEGKEEDKQIDSDVLELLIPDLNTYGYPYGYGE